MIEKVLMDGVAITNDTNIFLSSIRDIASARGEVNSYSRGGRSGISLGNPFYKGITIQLEFTVIGNSYTQLIEQRDRLAKFFRINPDKTVQQARTLAFELADGSTRQADAIFAPYVGSLSSSEVNKTIVQVTCQTEKEYLVSSVECETQVDIVDLGGFAVPIDVPLDMANKEDDYADETGGVVIRNQGNAEYYPTITFSGPINTFSLINDTTGKTLSYDDELQDEDSLVVDMYRHTAVKNEITNELSKIEGEGKWWWLEPGYNAVRLVAGGGTGNAKVTHRDSYRGF